MFITHILTGAIFILSIHRATKRTRTIVCYTSSRRQGDRLCTYIPGPDGEERTRNLPSSENGRGSIIS